MRCTQQLGTSQPSFCRMLLVLTKLAKLAKTYPLSLSLSLSSPSSECAEYMVYGVALYIVCNNLSISKCCIHVYRSRIPSSFVMHLHVHNSSTSSMIRLPLCPNRRRVAQYLTNVSSLHAKVLVQSLPNLALGTRAFQWLSVTFGLHFCERI
jgi:hypothetical protein